MAVPLFSPLKPCYIQMLSLSKHNECQVLVQGFCKIQEEKLSRCLASILVQSGIVLCFSIGNHMISSAIWNK